MRSQLLAGRTIHQVESNATHDPVAGLLGAARSARGERLACGIGGGVDLDLDGRHRGIADLPADFGHHPIATIAHVDLARHHLEHDAVRGRIHRLSRAYLHRRRQRIRGGLRLLAGDECEQCQRSDDGGLDAVHVDSIL